MPEARLIMARSRPPPPHENLQVRHLIEVLADTPRPMMTAVAKGASSRS